MLVKALRVTATTKHQHHRLFSCCWSAAALLNGVSSMIVVHFNALIANCILLYLRMQCQSKFDFLLRWTDCIVIGVCSGLGSDACIYKNVGCFKTPNIFD